MKKVEGAILKVLGWFMALLIFALMVDIFAAVLSRYIFRFSIPFAEELGRYLFVWITFTGMARCIADEKHVALDLISHVLKGPVKKGWKLAVYAITAFFFAALTRSGYALCLVGLKQKSPTMRIPMQYMYMIIPICGVLSLFFIVMRVIDLLRKDNEES